MKTKTQLEQLNTIQLRSEARNLRIPNYGKYCKEELVEKILELQSTHKEVIVETEQVFTDRHLIPIEKGFTVNARVKGTIWEEGTVIDFKIIEGEEYVKVLLKNHDKTRLIHSSDIEISKQSSKSPETVSPVPVIKEKENSSLPTDEPVIKSIKIETVLQSPTHEKVSKYDDILNKENLYGNKVGDSITFEVSKRDRVYGGQLLVGIIRSLIYDSQSKSCFFVIKVEGIEKSFYKTPKSLSI